MAVNSTAELKVGEGGVGDQELKVGEGGMGDQEFKVILSYTSYTRSNREQGISWPKKEEGQHRLVLLCSSCLGHTDSVQPS